MLSQPLKLTHKIGEVGKHMLIYGVGSALQSLLGFLLLPLYTNYLSTEEFGIYSFVTIIGSLSSVLFTIGLPSALNRFYFEKETETARNHVFSLLVLGTAATIIVQIVIAFALSSWLSTVILDTPIYKWAVFMSMVSSALLMFLNLIFSYLRIHRRSVLFITCNLTLFVVNVFINYFALSALHWGVTAPFAGLLICNSAVLVFLLIYLRKHFVFYFNWAELAYYGRFSFIITISGLLYYAFEWIDRFFIKEYMSLAEAGVYSLGYRIGMLIQVGLIIPFSMIWAPVRMQYSKDADTQHFFSLVTSYYSVVGLAAVAVTALFSHEILVLIAQKPEYWAAAGVVPLIMLAHFFFGYQNILDFGIYSQNKQGFYILIYSLSLLTNILLNILFIPRFGYIAAAYSKLASYIVHITMIKVISDKHFTIPLEYRRLMLLFLTVLPVIVTMTIRSNWGEYNIALKILTLLGIFTSWFIFFFNDSEKKLVKKYYNSLILRG